MCLERPHTPALDSQDLQEHPDSSIYYSEQQLHWSWCWAQVGLSSIVAHGGGVSCTPEAYWVSGACWLIVPLLSPQCFTDTDTFWGCGSQTSGLMEDS